MEVSNSHRAHGDVTCNWTCYPAHVVFVNGMKVYEYLPTDNSLFYIAKCLEQYYPKLTGVTSPVQVPVQ